ncbi:hypothetical protein Bca4012_024231 [Brassica carinata]
MGMSKSMKVIVSLALVVFLALEATNIEAVRDIDYNAIKQGDHDLSCAERPSSCKRVEVNRYHEGCENSKHCRT